MKIYLNEYLTSLLFLYLENTTEEMYMENKQLAKLNYCNKTMNLSHENIL